MKRNVRLKNWLVAVLLTGIVFSHTPPLRAQDDSPAKTPDQVVTTNAAPDEPVMAEEGTNAPDATGEEERARIRHRPIVAIGSDAILKEGESADAVVAIGGNATANGNVDNAVVAIGGNATAKRKVRDAVVAIAGDAEVEGEVGDAVVAIMGDVRIGPDSIVHGDAVAVGGKVEIAEGAQVKGEVVEIPIGEHPALLPLKGMADWFKHCVIKLRLLAPQAGWYWVVAGGFALFYLLIAVAFPRPVAACVNELTQRPATNFLMGLLTMVLVPLILLVLAMTGVGLVVWPFLLIAVFIGGMIGKAALFQYFGQKIIRAFGGPVATPALALLAGLFLVTLFYMVPLLSILIFKVTCVWAVGVATMASFGRARKETPAPSSPGSPPPTADPASPVNPPATTTMVFAATAAPTMPAEPNVAAVATGPEAGALPKSISLPPPVASEALNLPRASFWERMGAAFLDLIVTGILAGLVGGPPLGFLLVLAYFAGMWAWKGTTIGGLVLNLKVVRLDDKPVTFVVALVRGLAAALSTIVFFLGFFWMLWDRDKQTWHDKIAGTVVVRLPRGMSLVCL